MKKIFVLIMLLPIMHVNAATYYTEYSDYLLGTDEVIEEGPLIKKEEYKVYNTYEIRRKDIGYSNKELCTLYDQNDYIEEETYSKTKFNDDDKLYQGFAFNDMWIYRMSLKSVKNTNLSLKEIIVKDKDNKLDYTISSSISNIDNLKDGDEGTGITLARNASLLLLFDDYLVNDLTIEFVANQMVKSDLTMTMKTSETASQLFATLHFNADIIEFKSDEEIKKIKEVIGEFDNETVLGTYYKKVDKKYLCYENERVVLNNYVKDGDNIIEGDYKIIYDYQKRDYITLSDKEITKDSKLEDLVIETSFDLEDLHIEHNIDYSKSGSYEIKYVFPTGTITHDIDYVYVEDKKEETTTTTKPIIMTTTTKKPIIVTTKRVSVSNKDKVDNSNLLLESNTTDETTTTVKDKVTTAVVKEEVVVKEENKTIKIIIIAIILLILLTLFLTFKMT